MGNVPLTKNSEFVVSEEKVINYVMSVFFILLFQNPPLSYSSLHLSTQTRNE